MLTVVRCYLLTAPHSYYECTTYCNLTYSGLQFWLRFDIFCTLMYFYVCCELDRYSENFNSTSSLSEGTSDRSHPILQNFWPIPPTSTKSLAILPNPTENLINPTHSYKKLTNPTRSHRTSDQSHPLPQKVWPIPPNPGASLTNPVYTLSKFDQSHPFPQIFFYCLYLLRIFSNETGSVSQNSTN